MSLPKLAASLALLLAADALAYLPDSPPPSRAQRCQIDALARAYTGKKCSGVPSDYLWCVTVVRPYPASEIARQQADFLSRAQEVAEGWSGKALSSTLKDHGTFVRIHNLMRYSNGYQTETRYDLLTFHVTSGKVMREVNASCRLR